MANSIATNSPINDPIGQSILETVQKADYYNRWIFNLIKPYLQGEIIELGAGIGNFTQLLKNYRLTATDYNQQYLNKLDVPTFQFDLTSTVTPSALINKYDTAICFNVLEHIAEQNQALQNIKNTLRPGGRLIILVPAFQFAFGQLDRKLGHFRRYTRKTLCQTLERNGFIIEQSRYLNPLGLIGWVVNKIFKHGNISDWQINLFNLLSRPQLAIEKFIKFPFGLSVIAICRI